MNKWLVVLFMGIMVVFSSYQAFAQEENIQYGYGTVVKVDETTKEIVVSEYDWEGDTETTVTYSIDPNVKLENIASLGEITPDAYVDIEYVVMLDGKKVAKLISVYTPETGE